jgi:hypothetical protein
VTEVLVDLMFPFVLCGMGWERAGWWDGGMWHVRREEGAKKGYKVLAMCTIKAKSHKNDNIRPQSPIMALLQVSPSFTLRVWALWRCDQAERC